MTLLQDVGVPGAGAEPPANTVIYTSSTPGAWSFPVPVGVVFVQVEGWAAGGPGCAGTGGKGGFFPGNGGGGGAYWKKHLSVTGGVTVLSGVIGAPGNPIGPSSGGATTMPASSCTASGGTYATLAVAGVGGTASGGDTNTSGRNGALTNTWDGGGAGNGGGDQTAANSDGTIPGGGSAGYEIIASSPAAGQIKITSVTS